MPIVRMALVGPDLRVANIATAERGWNPGGGLVAVESATAGPGDVFDPVMGVFSEAPGVAAERRALALESVRAKRAELMAAGAPYAGKRVEVDDASRANLNSVVTVALICQGRLVPWPEALQAGWICLDNTRLPLPAPEDAIALGLTVSGWYSGLIQFARDRKNEVLAAADPLAAARAIDWSPWS